MLCMERGKQSRAEQSIRSGYRRRGTVSFRSSLRRERARRDLLFRQREMMTVVSLTTLALSIDLTSPAWSGTRHAGSGARTSYESVWAVSVPRSLITFLSAYTPSTKSFDSTQLTNGNNVKEQQRRRPSASITIRS